MGRDRTSMRQELTPTTVEAVSDQAVHHNGGDRRGPALGSVFPDPQRLLPFDPEQLPAWFRRPVDPLPKLSLPLPADNSPIDASLLQKADPPIALPHSVPDNVFAPQVEDGRTVRDLGPFPPPPVVTGNHQATEVDLTPWPPSLDDLPRRPKPSGGDPTPDGGGAPHGPRRLAATHGGPRQGGRQPPRGDPRPCGHGQPALAHLRRSPHRGGALSGALPHRHRGHGRRLPRRGSAPPWAPLRPEGPEPLGATGG